MENGFAKYPPIQRYLGISERWIYTSKTSEVSSTKGSKRNNELALEIIYEDLTKVMKDKLKTITSAKELLLRLEQIYKVDDEEDEEKLLEMIVEANEENKMRKSQQFKSEEPSNIEVSNSDEPSSTGKYTGNISEPPVDFIENDCSKVEKCFYSQYNPESEMKS